MGRRHFENVTKTGSIHGAAPSQAEPPLKHSEAHFDHLPHYLWLIVVCELFLPDMSDLIFKRNFFRCICRYTSFYCCNTGSYYFFLPLASSGRIDDSLSRGRLRSPEMASLCSRSSWSWSRMFSMNWMRLVCSLSSSAFWRLLIMAFRR